MRTLMVALGVVLLAALLVPAGAQVGGELCVGDRTGDQRQELNPDRPDLLVDPDGASDLVEVCADPDGAVVITTAAATGLEDAGAAWLHPGSAIAVGMSRTAAGEGASPDAVVVVGTMSDGTVAAEAVDAAGVLHATCEVVVDEAVVTVAAGCGPDDGIAGLQVSLRLVADPSVDYSPVIVDRLPDGGGWGPTAGAPGVPPSRLAGPDRIVTAVDIARAQFPDGAAAVYLARADDLADAVAGGVLTGGPVLLVPACAGVPATVVTAIGALDPAEVVALGGEQAVCEVTLQAAADGRPAGRLAGPDRFGTAAEVAARAFPGGADEVFLARGDDLADAVAAGSLRTGPVLLVPGGCGEVPEGVHLAVRRLLPSRVVALGGTAAVCEAVLQAVALGDDIDEDLDPVRLGGADRFETAALIAQRAFPGGAPTLFLARADDPADAVAGGSLTDGPTLLVPTCGDVPPSTGDALGVVKPDRVVSLGGHAAVCDATLAAVADLVAGPRG